MTLMDGNTTSSFARLRNCLPVSGPSPARFAHQRAHVLQLRLAQLADRANRVLPALDTLEPAFEEVFTCAAQPNTFFVRRVKVMDIRADPR